MQNNPVMEVIQTAFQMEIANEMTTTTEGLVVTLADHKRVLITTTPITTGITQPHPKPDTHTYHYIHQHDFGYGQVDEIKTVKRLTLRNIEDCRSYLDDVCESFLNATNRDFEITFADGTAYLITIEPL